MTQKKTTTQNNNTQGYKGVTIRSQQYSESFDEYLEIIYRLSKQNPGGWVKNKEISNRLQVKAPSVSNMLEKLKREKLVNWTPRKGIRLTEQGRNRAKQIVQNHIVMELFLERVLNYKDAARINEIACDLEHHIDSELNERLQKLLGVSVEIKNVDNFISEDKLPEHIPTHPIYSEKEINEKFEQIKENIKNTLQKHLEPKKFEEVYSEIKENFVFDD